MDPEEATDYGAFREDALDLEDVLGEDVEVGDGA